MDPLSLGIIVTVLSVGSVLVFLFKSDFDERRQRTIAAGKLAGNPPASSKPTPRSATKGQSAPTNNANGVQRPSANRQQQNNQQKATHKAPIIASQTTQVEGLEPAIDECDESILLDVFQSANRSSQKLSSSNNNNNVIKQKQQQKQAANNENGTGHNKRSQQRDSVAPKRKSALEEVNSFNYSNSKDDDLSTYSSERLFTLIAASNLSQDEVELAIETLLNKRLESGESSWRQPKSDPLLKLRKQLRDQETALTFEVQSHSQTRIRCDELQEIRVKLQQQVKALGVASERSHAELQQLQLTYKQLKEESAQVIGKLEQERAQLQQLLAGASAQKEAEIAELRQQLEDKLGQLQRYELSSQTMGEKIQELEAKLRQAELQLDQVRSSKHHDDYEACAKISDLESDKLRMDKSLKDHVARLKEVLEANSLLEKSVNELQLINGRQEEMLKRSRDERHVNEASMKRTLCEMEQELKELQSKLSSNSHSLQEEKLRKEISQVERELSDADQREQRLTGELAELKEGLSALFPDLKAQSMIRANEVGGNNASSWVGQYLATVKQLAKTVDELRETNNNNIVVSKETGNGVLPPDSPSKKSLVDKSTITPLRQTNGALQRVGSPISAKEGGRTSKTGSYYDSDSHKKDMETKLLELTDYVTQLEAEIQAKQLSDSSSQLPVDQQQPYEQQIKELKLQRSKLEAQVKIGLDSLRMEQERAKSLEIELNKFAANTNNNNVEFSKISLEQ